MSIKISSTKNLNHPTTSGAFGLLGITLAFLRVNVHVNGRIQTLGGFMRKLILLIAVAMLAGCAPNKGTWQATERVNVTAKEADRLCWKITELNPPSTRDGDYMDCLESKGFIYVQETDEVTECKRQCKAEFRKISDLEKQFSCLDMCEAKSK
jgi:hypothetical protein